MTSKTLPKTKSTDAKRLYPAYAYEIAGRLDAESRKFAQQLHEAGYVYAFYSALDGLSISYSTIKYFFDVIFTNSSKSSSDAMHEWMMTPEGIALAATESVSIIGFALLANLFDENDKNSFKRFFAIAWPYMRDVFKGTKNAYKGVISTVKMANMLGGLNLNYLILPVGLALGALSALNRIWYRYIVGLRKDMMKANDELLKEIQEVESLSSEQSADKRLKIQKQSNLIRAGAFLSAAYAGFIDSLYLYIGVLGLCSLAWPAFVAMSVFCVIYSVGCVITRIYDEYDYQRKLEITQAKIELALCRKEHGLDMQASFARLHQISKDLAKNYSGKILTEKQQNEASVLYYEQHNLARDIMQKFKIFNEKRANLQSLLTLSQTSAFLVGVKHGLAAYGALASVMFAIGTILFLSATAFPAALLISFVSLGMALLIGFIAHAMITNYYHRIKQEQAFHKPSERLSDILKGLKDVKRAGAEETAEVDINTIMDDGMKLDPSPQFFFQEWFEVIRSFFSGLGKGSKTVDYTLNPLQEVDEKGHYHDTPIMFAVTGLSAVVYSVGLACRAHARGFGRPPLVSSDDIALVSSKMTTSFDSGDTPSRGYDDDEWEPGIIVGNSSLEKSEPVLTSGELSNKTGVDFKDGHGVVPSNVKIVEKTGFNDKMPSAEDGSAEEANRKLRFFVEPTPSSRGESDQVVGRRSDSSENLSPKSPLNRLSIFNSNSKCNPNINTNTNVNSNCKTLNALYPLSPGNLENSQLLAN